MGRLLLVDLPATGAAIYRCKHCGTHLACRTDIISKAFRCKKGAAYLMDKIVNVTPGEKAENRQMTTGVHTVRDILCVACGCVLGWKYLAAFNKDQRYKEGKFIMDRNKVTTRTPGDHHSHSSSSSSSSNDDDEDDEDDDDSSSSEHHHHQEAI